MKALEGEINVRGLYYAYPDDQVALRGINFDFKPGTFYTILGRNGSGKSTLARTLNALLIPTKGKVYSCGLDTHNPSNHIRIRSTVAMVFQDPATQIVCNTVEEEIAFGPENLGLPPEEIKRRVEEAIRLAGVEELRTRATTRLSLGEKQLVAIAGALAMKPSFLISDESTSMLDFEARKRVLDIFLRLKDTGTGIIHITHFLEEAGFSDFSIIMEDGKISDFGTPQEILGNPENVLRKGLEPLIVTEIVRQLKNLGETIDDNIITVGGLLAWLKN